MCVACVFFSLLKYVILIPNTGHYMTNSPFSSSNGLNFTLDLLSGHVPVISVLSGCRVCVYACVCVYVCMCVCVCVLHV